MRFPVSSVFASVVLVVLLAVPSRSFSCPSSPRRRTLDRVSWREISRRSPTSCLSAKNQDKGNDEVDVAYLKSQLQEYLTKRMELGGDDLAKAEIGKVVGGSKGNAILEYISGAPNKEMRIEDAPNALDYDQLTKYGYSHLVTPIMKAGGRLAMYDLLGMEPPDTSKSLRPVVVTAPKLVIDREGKTDKARYTGLRLTQVIDDDLQAEVLAQAKEKTARGEDLRPKLEEETYEQPFADKRNVSPQMTPDWTPGEYQCRDNGGWGRTGAHEC